MTHALWFYKFPVRTVFKFSIASKLTRIRIVHDEEIHCFLVPQPLSSVTKKSIIPEVIYREPIAEYGFPIKDFGNDDKL